MRIATAKVAAVTLLGISAVFLAQSFLVVRSNDSGVLPGQIVPWQPPVKQGFDMSKLAIAPAQQVDSLARPLFMPERRQFQPPPPPPQQVEAVPPPPPPEQITIAPQPVAPIQLTLKGVMMTEGLDKAYLVGAENPGGDWYSRGAVISGWTIDLIQNESVTISQGDQRQVLKLYVDNLPLPLGSQPAAN